MKRRRSGGVSRWYLLALAVLLVLALFWFSVSLKNLEALRQEKGVEQLEDALRRAAVACYAAEGIYPPDLAYLTEHYGIQIDDEKYFVHYEGIAENLMPEITVISQEQ